MPTSAPLRLLAPLSIVLAVAPSCVGTQHRAGPPVELTVFESAGRLDYVRGTGFGGRVVHVAGPWKLRGEWWSADPFAREYYDVELSDGGVYRIYRDLCPGRGGGARWWADGVYD